MFRQPQVGSASATGMWSEKATSGQHMSCSWKWLRLRRVEFGDGLVLISQLRSTSSNRSLRTFKSILHSNHFVPNLDFFFLLKILKGFLFRSSSFVWVRVGHGTDFRVVGFSLCNATLTVYTEVWNPITSQNSASLCYQDMTWSLPPCECELIWHDKRYFSCLSHKQYRGLGSSILPKHVYLKSWCVHYAFVGNRLRRRWGKTWIHFDS